MSDWDDEEEWGLEDLQAVAALEHKALESRQQVSRQQQQSTASVAPSVAAGTATVAQPQRSDSGEPCLTGEGLLRCVRHFAKLPPPPLRPSQADCPGVYGRGCGGALRLVRLEDVSFWACSTRACAYREFPPERKLSPELSITLDRQRGAVDVAPMPGAQDAVRFCGGVAAVLQAAGVDLRAALPAPAPDQAQTEADSGAAADSASRATAAPRQPCADAGADPVMAQGPAGQLAPPRGSADAAAEAGGSGPAHSEATMAAQGQHPPSAPSQPPPVSFPLSRYEWLRERLSRFGSRPPGISLLTAGGMVPQPTLASARGKWRQRPPPDEVCAAYARMPAPLQRALLPFQREGVRFGLARGGRCLLADEMGVGKTVQAIALAACYQEEWPLLVVAPASLRLQWAEELERWLPHLRPSSIHVVDCSQSRVARDAMPLVAVTSYEMTERLSCPAAKGRAAAPPGLCAGARPPCSNPHFCLACMRWRVVIVDESHTLRTSSHPPDAAHTEAVACAVRGARRAVLLSGTPSLSRPYDLYRQVDALSPGLLGRSRTDFAQAYCGRRLVPVAGRGGERHRKWHVGGLSRGPELHDLLRAEVMVRRLKRDVLSQLPPKRRQVIRLPRPPTEHWPKAAPGQPGSGEDSEEEEEEGGGGSGSDSEEEEGGEGGSEQGRRGMSQWQRTGVAKVPAVVDWLMTALGARKGGDDGGMGGGGGEAAGPKLLVFAHHRRVMNRLAAALEGAAGYAPVPYVRIDGSTDAEDRCLAVRRFRHEPALRVALLSVTAAGVGLDFSAAALVVFAELPGEVAHVRQAEDRAHRQGQSHPVNVYFLCAKGTTDDRRWQQLNRSLARVAAVHDGAGEGGSGNEAVAAQAGLLVDGVLDAEEGGMTQAAAGARGWAPPPTSAAAQLGHQEWPGDGSEAPSRRDSPGGGTQTGESPLPPATAAAAMRAAAAAAAGGEVGAGVPHCCACERPAAGSAPESVAANPAETADSRAGAAEECSPRGTQVPAAAPPAPSPALQGPASASTPPQAPASAACPPAQPCGGVPVWFEVSANTQRVHLHGAADGSAPLHLSLPQEALLAHGSPALQQLLEAVRAAEQAQGEQQQTQQGGAEGQHGSQGGQQGAAAAAAAGSGCSPPVIPGVGVVALDPGLGVGRLAAMLAEAREFAAEWAELRSLFRSRLYNTVLRLPLQEAVEEVERAAAAAGRLGTSHARFVGGQGGRADLALPPGAAWHAVKVVFPSHGREGTYQQPFSAEGGRLCMNCAKAVPLPSGSLPREAVLEGMAALFCGGDCEGWYARKSNGSACRRALFALERGVCVLCRLDCHALVKRLQAVEKGTRGWEAARRRIVAQHWPRLLARGYGAYLDLLIRRAVQGHAWQADHVVPVYKGGGLCDVDNLRTLCVACHADVTKAQARERKQAREAARAGSSLAAGAGKNAAPKRRNRIPRMICEDSGEEGPDARQLQQQPQPAKEGDSAAPPRPMRRQRKLKPLISDAEDGEVPLMQDAGGGEPPGAAAGQGAAGGKRPLSSSAPTSQVSDAAQPRKRGRAAAPGQSRVPAVKRRERASGRSYVDDEAL